MLCGLGRVRGKTGLAQSDYLDEAWFLRLDGMTPRWRRSRAQGRPPGGRAGHAACAVGPHVVLFGGVNAKQFLGDLFVFYACRAAWSSPLVAGPAPGPHMRPALVYARAGPADTNAPALYGTRRQVRRDDVVLVPPACTSLVSDDSKFDFHAAARGTKCVPPFVALKSWRTTYSVKDVPLTAGSASTSRCQYPPCGF